MYYSNVPYKVEYTKLINTKNIQTYSDDETFLKRLDDHGYLYIKDLALLIIQDHKHITKLFDKGMFNDAHLKTMLKSAIVFTLGKKTDANKQVRILIDPHK
jgi:hypothetical protein